MNDEPKIPSVDRLTWLLTEQRRLQQDTFRHDFDNWTDEERVDYIRLNVLALVDELHELLGEVGWKPWASSRHVNQTQALGEWVDALHFMLNLAIAIVPDVHPDVLAGLVETGYAEKHGKNARRQEVGYDGTSTKCPRCKRALDDRDNIVYIQMSTPSGVHRTRYACAGCQHDLEDDFTHEELRQILELARGTAA